MCQRNYRSMNATDFTEFISDEICGSRRLILVENNNIQLIISIVHRIINDYPDYEILYQINPYFPHDLDEGDMNYADIQQQFTDFINFFDRYRKQLLIRMNKKYFNYTSGQWVETIEYPQNGRSILIMQNFNFWDHGSQSFVAKLVYQNPGLLVIGQYRTDFDFVRDHINPDVMGRATIVNLDIDAP